MSGCTVLGCIQSPTISIAVVAHPVPLAFGVSQCELCGGEETMTIISHGVVALAMVWTLWHLVYVRKQLRGGAIVVPPVVAATLVFALCIVVVMLTGVSPLHLVWLFPVSFLVGLVLLIFPLGTKLLRVFLVLLAGVVESSAQPQAWSRPTAGRRRKKSSVSPGTPRRTRASRRRRFR